MKTIYIDSNYHCHITNDGTMTEVQTDMFDGMSDLQIECCLYKPLPDDGCFVQCFDSVSEDKFRRQYQADQSELDSILTQIEQALGGST